ncbi:MAG: winged helix-turn-helix domain-containing protein [Candidatus Hodarchaeota archaeon]
MKPLRINFRVWIELDEPLSSEYDVKKKGRRKETSRFICGKGVTRLLDAIDKTHSLTKAAKEVGYSYKYAWDRTQKIKSRLGEPAVEAQKGGKGGGGNMHLSTKGKEILEMYKEHNDFVNKCLENKEKIVKSGLLD